MTEQWDYPSERDSLRSRGPHIPVDDYSYSEMWVWISRLNAGDTTQSPTCPTCGARRLVFWPDAWTVERDVTHRCDGCGALCWWDEGGPPSSG